MENKYLFVKEYELSEYLNKSKKTNRILVFWKEIFRNMPLNLKDEATVKRTYISKQSKGEFDITGAIPYQFETKKASDELVNYLDRFAVFVEHDTPEIYKWKEKIKLLKSMCG